MLFEVINPSDAVFFEADSFDIACVACIAVGKGNYGLRGIKGTQDEMPIFLLGGAEEWFKKRFDKTLDEVVSGIIPSRRSELATCLDGWRIGEERATKDETDKNRTSMNNICGAAWSIAKNLRNAEGTK